MLGGPLAAAVVGIQGKILESVRNPAGSLHPLTIVLLRVGDQDAVVDRLNRFQRLHLPDHGGRSKECPNDQCKIDSHSISHLRTSPTNELYTKQKGRPFWPPS